MKEILLLKDGEIVLKGLNRRSFEDVLKKNLFFVFLCFVYFVFFYAHT